MHCSLAFVLLFSIGCVLVTGKVKPGDPPCPIAEPYHRLEVYWTDTWIENGRRHNQTGSGLMYGDMVKTDARTERQRIDSIMFSYTIDGMHQPYPYDYKSTVVVMDRVPTGMSPSYNVEWLNGVPSKAYVGGYPVVATDCENFCTYLDRREEMLGYDTYVWKCYSQESDPARRMEVTWWLDSRYGKRHPVYVYRQAPNGHNITWTLLRPFEWYDHPFAPEIWNLEKTFADYRKQLGYDDSKTGTGVRPQSIDGSGPKGDSDDDSSSFWTDHGGLGIWLVIVGIVAAVSTATAGFLYLRSQPRLGYDYIRA